MFVARSIAADHKDLIHDVSYDFHGRRMATCSSDQSVKVTQINVVEVSLPVLALAVTASLLTVPTNINTPYSYQWCIYWLSLSTSCGRP